MHPGSDRDTAAWTWCRLTQGLEFGDGDHEHDGDDVDGRREHQLN